MLTFGWLWRHASGKDTLQQRVWGNIRAVVPQQT